MSDRHVRCTVESMNYSACGLKKGDYFEVGPEGLTMPDGQSFCYFAIGTALPLINGRINSATADEWIESKPLLQCPDPPEALWMRLEAVDREPTTGENP